MSRASHSTSASAVIRQFWTRIVPKLTNDAHKGSCGRVAVIGGSSDYSGAPFFSGLAAMRCGADLVYVLCPPDAALGIKTYSPDLCVRPLLALDRLDECIKVASNCHSVVIGPGIGDSDTNVTDNLLPQIVRRLRATTGVPIVLDTAIMSRPQMIEAIMDTNNAKQGDDEASKGKGASTNAKKNAASTVYLTPNRREINALASAVLKRSIEDFNALSPDDQMQTLLDVGHHLQCVIILKGPADLIVDARERHKTATHVATARKFDSDPNDVSPRRAAGQGDVLAGLIATFCAWSQQLEAPHPFLHAEQGEVAFGLVAPSCACLLARSAGGRAFRDKRRSMLASDVLDHVGPAFETIESALSTEVSTSSGLRHSSHI